MDIETKWYLDNRLPDQQERFKQAEQELQALRRIEHVYADTDRTYTLSHDDGPFQVNVDTSGMEEYLEDVSEGFADLEEANQELQQEVVEVGRIQEKGNVFLERIAEDTETNLSLGKAALVLQGVQAMVQRNAALDSAEILQNTIGIRILGEDSLDLQTKQLGLGEKAFDVSRRSLACLNDIKGTLEEGLSVGQDIRGAVEGIEDGVQDIRGAVEGIEDGVQDLIGSVDTLSSMIWGRFDSLLRGMDDLYLVQQQQLVAIVLGQKNLQEGLAGLNRAQAARFDTLLSSVEYQGATEFGRRALEKYSFASEQYRAGNFGVALRDVCEVLDLQSTHLPSRLLFSQLCLHYGQWNAAKDMLYTTRSIALQRPDPQAYEAAVIGLSQLEQLLGNGDLARLIAQKGLDDFGDEDRPPTGRLYALRRRSLRLNCQQWVSEGELELAAGKVAERLRTDWEYDPGLFPEVLSRPEYTGFRDRALVLGLDPLVRLANEYRGSCKSFPPSYTYVDIPIELRRNAARLSNFLENIVASSTIGSQDDLGVFPLLYTLQKGFQDFDQLQILWFGTKAKLRNRIETFQDKGADFSRRELEVGLCKATLLAPEQSPLSEGYARDIIAYHTKKSS